MTTPTEGQEPGSGRILCDNCGAEHVATYSHESQWSQGHIYAVVCPQDHLTDYYTSEAFLPDNWTDGRA